MLNNTTVRIRSKTIIFVNWVIILSGFLTRFLERVPLNDNTKNNQILSNWYSSTTATRSSILVTSFITSPSLYGKKLVSSSSSSIYKSTRNDCFSTTSSIFMIRSKDDIHDEFLQDGKRFVSTLMNAVEIDIPDSNGMKVLRNIPTLESCGEPSDIIVRSVDDDFWTACIEQVGNPSTPRLVAVGNPGIGKSRSIPILIRKLLKARKTVVYIVRSERNELFYYEFIPGVGDSVITNIYPESLSSLDIESLWLDTTFYIVDPSKYTGTCDPCDLVKAKVIIVASPHEKYWGGSQFAKRRGNSKGVFKYYPLWTLDELLLARETLRSKMSEADVYEGYRLFGGIPGNVFYGGGTRTWLAYQDNCINLLTLHEARWITRGDGYATNTFTSGSLKSFILGFISSKETSFSVPQTVLLSSRIADRIGLKHMSDLWNYKFEWKEPGYEIFKGYCRSLLYDKMGAKAFECRTIGSKDTFGGWTLLGRCSSIRLVPDPVGEVTQSNPKNPFVLFLANNKCNNLFDFIYKDEHGHYDAFRVTLGKKWSTLDMDELQTFENKVGGPNKLTLYYLIPYEKYPKFRIETHCSTEDEGDVTNTCGSDITIILAKPLNQVG